MSPADESAEVFRLREDVVWRQIEDETVLLDLRTSTYLSTNVSATVLWERLAQGATHAQLVEALRTRFEVTPERASEDVDQFLLECRNRLLLQDAATT